jgi:hypothetical protein
MLLSQSLPQKCLFCFFVLFASLFTFIPVQADVPDMMINTDGTSEIHNMSQIWVSPVDSNVVMTVWRDFRLGYRRVALGVSYDEGHTWVDSLLSVPLGCQHSDPIICGDLLGNFYPMTMIFYPLEEYFDFSLWKTTDNGASWSGPSYVLGGPTGYTDDKEFLAIDRTGGIHDGNMYVAWTRFPNPTSMMFARSTSGGASWEDPLLIAGPDTTWGAGHYAFPLVDAFGNVYVAWEGWLQIEGEYYCCQKMVKSTDGGQSFTDPEVICMSNYVNEAPGGIRIYNSSCLDADITNGPYRGNIYLAVPSGIDEEYNSPSDIIFVKSTDSGDTWSTPIRVNDDPEGPSVYQFHPWLAVNQKGAVIVFFYDQRNDSPLYEKFDTYIAFSFDGGETFTTNYRVSDVSSDPEDALTEGIGPIPFDATDIPFRSALEPESSTGMILCNYIGVAAYYDQIHCTWTDTRDGNQNVYYSNFGIPLLAPRLALPEDGSYQLPPLLAFKWAACGYFGETIYDLEISTDSTFAAVDYEYTDLDTNVFEMSTPLYPQVPALLTPKDSLTISAYAPTFRWTKESMDSELEYFWQVKAFRITDTCESEYSDAWSFTVDVSAAVFYTLQVADDSLFLPGPEFYEYTDIYDTSFAIPDTLLDSTLYYWRVKAQDEDGHESDWQDRPFQFYACHFVRGDANGDGVVGPADVVYLINYFFRNYPAPNPMEAGDCNCDQAVDPGDVVYLLNYLFRGWPPPSC